MIAKIQVACLGLLGALLLLASAGCSSTKPASSQKYAFWPPYPDEPRLQYLCSFDSSASVAPKKSKLDELVYGKEIEQSQSVAKPYGLDMWNGKIYVCDLRSNAIVILDLRNQQAMMLGKSGADTFHTPSDITIAPDGYKYVADIGRGAIFVYDPADRFAGTFELPELKPVGVAVFENELFVADFKQQCVQVMDRFSGQLLRTIGSAGQGPGQFIRPLGIATDAEGFLYVTDVLNCRMQKFDRQGNLVSSFGIISANAGGFVRPKHIAVDSDGTIFVVDAAFQNVQLFDQVGRVYTFFGSAGSHPGAMYLPAGVAVIDTDLDLFAPYVHPAFEMERVVLVTNQFGDNKIAAYAYGRLKQGKTTKDIETTYADVRVGATQGVEGSKGPALPNPTTLPAGTVGQVLGSSSTADNVSASGDVAARPAAPAAPASPAATPVPSATPAAANVGQPPRK